MEENVKLTTQPTDLSTIKIGPSIFDPTVEMDLHPKWLFSNDDDYTIDTSKSEISENDETDWSKNPFYIGFRGGSSVNKTKTSTNNDATNDDGTIVDILKEEGFKFKVTSDYRPNAKTKSGNVSNHAKKGGAYDIQPLDGNYDKFRKELYANPRVVQWLSRHKWGIIEEITPEAHKKYGSTGNHFHFGPDNDGVETSKKYGVQYAQEGAKLTSDTNVNAPSYATQQPHDYMLQNLQSLIDSLGSYSNDGLETYSDDTPIASDNDDWSNNPFYIGFKSTTTPKSTTPKSTTPKSTTPKSTTPKSTTTTNESSDLQSLINQTTSDQEEQQILYKIAINESSGNINSSTKVSTASGWFGFTNATKKQYGWNSSPLGQVQAADRLYKSHKVSLMRLVGLYGSRGKSFAQLMYGMWWNPKATQYYLKNGKYMTGKDGKPYRDGLGTTLETIFNKMK